MKVKVTLVTESNNPLSPYIDPEHLIVVMKKAWENLTNAISINSGEKTTVESVELIEE